MQRILVFAYGVFAYLLFLIVFGYMAGFLLGFIVPKGINDPAVTTPMDLMASIALNIVLVALFGVLHSLLARDHVKRQLLKVLPEAAERSTYVVQSSLCLALAMWLWQPLPTVIWETQGLATGLAYLGFGIGAGLVLWSTFQIDHFELFGLRQIWTHLKNKQMPAPEFRTPFLYRIVRHPMQLGVMILLLSTPLMTVGHAVFAGAMIGYIFIGLYFEERALLRMFGARYEAYRTQVPMLIPGLPPRKEQMRAWF